METNTFWSCFQYLLDFWRILMQKLRIIFQIVWVLTISSEFFVNFRVIHVWLSLILFYIGWPQQPQIEKVLKSNLIFHESTKDFFSKKKHRNKAEFYNLDDSEVLNSDFPGLRTSAASMTSITSVASMTSTASFHQRTSWTWWSDHPWYQNDQYWSLFKEWIIKNPVFLLISDTLSVGGCWGQPILLFWKMVTNVKMS